MKTYVKEILRWAAIVAFGGFGLWVLISMAYPLFTNRSGGVFIVFFMTLYFLVVSLPSFAVAYFCYRREYRKIFLCVGVIGGFAVFAVLSILLNWIDFPEYPLDHNDPSSIWLGILGLPLSLLFLFGPIFAAAWFFRLCRNYAYRGTNKIKTGIKTKATGWLVAVGLLLIVLPMLVPLLMFVGEMTSSSPPSLDWVEENGIHFRLYLGSLGTLLMIVGLAWRRPVGERHEKASIETSKTQIEADGVENPAVH